MWGDWFNASSIDFGDTRSYVCFMQWREGARGIDGDWLNASSIDLGDTRAYVCVMQRRAVQFSSLGIIFFFRSLYLMFISVACARVRVCTTVRIKKQGVVTEVRA